MKISSSFAETPLPSTTQKYLLVLMALLLPPLPIFLLTSPKHTIRTKEFFISFLLTFLMYFAGILYSIYFICFAFPSSKTDGYFRLGDEENQNAPVQAEAAAPAKAAPAETVSQTEGPSDGLPSYEESETPKDIASKVGDHKVQL
ncbi:Proteolipid membrane putative modulator family protein [Clavispora lusitaniae]|uniref:Uncharacterized protein n=2 Tax=Clavispora lusitaniae TaxID=36911 RepID=C4Y849_CLAL4|nr:uncharacterized protein CLUG_04377 [Clavispora lusitaniae ATCC 42720]EEQ40249.1 predicted protein [Clavispora lusitaniae ATCC 42720]KAF7581808.1 Proteolipid membrane putative modulator family protein [Clavispora lusitaniae]OVF09650.1 hypothetical protein A9F13_04g01309 [Clavispora lusitaniae]